MSVEHEPKIQNIVSTIHMEIKDSEGNKTDEKLNLDKIASKCRNCEYKKSKYIYFCINKVGFLLSFRGSLSPNRLP